MNNTPGIDEMWSKQWWSMRNSRDRHVERSSPVGALNKNDVLWWDLSSCNDTMTSYVSECMHYVIIHEWVVIFLQKIWFFTEAIWRIIGCNYLSVGNANYTRGLSFLPEVGYTLPLWGRRNLELCPPRNFIIVHLSSFFSSFKG